MIELKNITKKYLKNIALDSISLAFPKGKIIGLIGGNGSGKTTVLKVIAGLIKPSAGIVTINGGKVNRRSSQIVSFLSEADAYYSFYNVKETIDFYASQFKDFNKKKAIEMLEFMRLNPKQRVRDLSKGNRGRLKIVLSLSREVPVILMDEPLSGLDPLVRESIVKGLISFIDMSKQTVIIATHEIKEIEALLDMVAIIDHGKIIKFLEVEDIRQNERLSLVDWLKKFMNGKEEFVDE